MKQMPGIIFDNVELKEIKPNYLDNFTYARYGINIDDVNQLNILFINGATIIDKPVAPPVTIPAGSRKK